MMASLKEETTLLDTVSELIAASVRRLCCFVDDPILRSLGSKFAANLARREVDLGFNTFALVSDMYYRENFHSDVMAAILDPKGSHGQGDRFLKLFLEFLRDRHHLDIEPDDYTNAQVVRESANIDVLIWDKTSGILEKINLADAFTETSNERPAKKFAFPSEEMALQEFLEKILRSLSDYVNTMSAVK